MSIALAPTLEQYLAPWVNRPEFARDATPLLHQRAIVLLSRVTEAMAEAEKFGVTYELNSKRGDCMTSGWRPSAYNSTVPNAAPRSLHILGGAVDLYDPEGVIDTFFFGHEGHGIGREILVKHNLWMEHPSATKGWAHFQDKAPRSNNRFFFP